MAILRVKIDGPAIKAAINFVKLIYDISNSLPPRYPGDLEAAKLYNPYEVLGLSPRATNEELKQRYRQLTVVWHPDKKGGNEEAMKRLNNAYDEIREQRQIKP